MTTREKCKIPYSICGHKVVSVRTFHRDNGEKPYIAIQYEGSPGSKENPDDALRKLMKKAGYEDTGSGYDLMSGRRDISFEKIRKVRTSTKKVAR